MKKLICIITVALLTSCSTGDKTTRKLASVDRPPQYVLMSFDGSKSLDMWAETTAFAKEQDVKFTYFISGVYFVARDDRRRYYSEPRMGPGISAIGWGKKESDISNRFRAVRDAINEGHEIASHANAHFTGLAFTNYKGKKIPAFTKSNWDYEFEQFDTIMKEGVRRYDVRRMPDWWEDYFSNRNIGFRAPQLGYNKAMFQSLADNGYTYDTSKTARMDHWPKKANGVWSFPLAGLPMEGYRTPVKSMDYNFFVRHSGGKTKEDESHKWKDYEDEMFEIYMGYFRHNYFGNRAPLDIGHHFSKWNGGAYWKALKRFAVAVCSKPEVKCVTYAELQEFLEDQGGDKIASYQAGKFEKVRELNLPAFRGRKSGNKHGRSGWLGREGDKLRELTEAELQQLREERINIPHDDVD